MKAKAKGNIQILGYQSFEVLKDHMQRAKGFVFAAEEDFGITPVEAQACGTPVITYGKGGATETVLDLNHEKPTGLFFKEQTVGSIVEKINEFEKSYDKFTPSNCRENAIRFSPERFREEIRSIVEEKYNENF